MGKQETMWKKKIWLSHRFKIFLTERMRKIICINATDGAYSFEAMFALLILFNQSKFPVRYLSELFFRPCVAIWLYRGFLEEKSQNCDSLNKSGWEAFVYWMDKNQCHCFRRMLLFPYLFDTWTVKLEYSCVLLTSKCKSVFKPLWCLNWSFFSFWLRTFCN